LIKDRLIGIRNSWLTKSADSQVRLIFFKKYKKKKKKKEKKEKKKKKGKEKKKGEKEMEKGWGRKRV